MKYLVLILAVVSSILCEDDYAYSKIECPEDHCIRILSVSDEGCETNPDKPARNYVMKYCDHQRSCELSIDCYQDVTYECQPCSDDDVIRKKRSSGWTTVCHARPKNPKVAVTSVVTKGRIQCPNNVFETKHVCRTCGCITDVENFAHTADVARHTRGWTLTNFTSVFSGNPTYNYDPSQDLCVFNNYHDKFTCSKVSTGWRCTHIAQAIAKHKRLTGHYDRIWDVYHPSG